MNLNVIVTTRPKRVIMNVSMRLNDDSYWLDRGQGWELQLLARLDRNSSSALSIEKTGTVGLAIDPQKELRFLDQQIANVYYTPSDGFSTHVAHPDGYDYDSTPHSLLSLMTPEYETPAFDYSNGVWYIPPRKASMLHGHGVGLFYWGREQPLEGHAGSSRSLGPTLYTTHA
eukprot:6191662-Pleurochrysis_carterae.AAC.1